MRPSRDQWAMDMAILTAKRATCLRRSVGAVLLNERGHVLATGYNGVAAGQLHCNYKVVSGYEHFSDEGEFRLNNVLVTGEEFKMAVAHPHACSGAFAQSGTNLDGCQAIHAEQNALLQCRDIYAIDTCYVTASPCMTCVKLLLNSSCRRIVFLEEYPHVESGKLWTSSGRVWEKFEPQD